MAQPNAEPVEEYEYVQDVIWNGQELEEADDVD